MFSLQLYSESEHMSKREKWTAGRQEDIADVRRHLHVVYRLTENADGAVAAAAWDLVEVLRRESSFFGFANPWAQMFRSLFQHLAAKKAQDANIGLIQLRTSRLQIGKP